MENSTRLLVCYSAVAAHHDIKEHHGLVAMEVFYSDYKALPNLIHDAIEKHLNENHDITIIDEIIIKSVCVI